MELMSQFDEDGGSEIEIDALRYDNNTRFEVVPRCLITVNNADYRWVAPVSGENAPNKAFWRSTVRYVAHTIQFVASRSRSSCR